MAQNFSKFNNSSPWLLEKKQVLNFYLFSLNKKNLSICIIYMKMKTDLK